MELVRGGDYSVRAEESPRDEIGRLGASFNAMTGKIQDNVNKLVEKEQREKLLQYNLMVSAIDPHFINNTLNTSTRLAELGRTDDVVAVNDALINFLKDNLKMKSYQTFDTVENELNALRQYIIIQNYLCDNTVAIEYNVSPGDMEMKIPKFLLQPLVENAILHGIVMNVDENGQYIGGIIKVSVNRDEDYVYISVKDNGVGMDAATVKRYFEDRQEEGEDLHEHIGVMNMRIRLGHLYGEDWRMSVTSELGKGTEVVVRLRRFE
jgi:sensor histidine kinase YesM